MTPATMAWGRAKLPDPYELRVIEVGAFDVNGSYRSIVAPDHPREYIGIDISPGPGVDQVCSAFDAPERFGEFDLVICTEVMEHERDWKGLVRALKCLTRIGGTLVITTRSPGFAYHPYPEDHWRFTIADFLTIFADMDIVALDSDPAHPGVFLRAIRTGEIVEPPDLALAPAR